MRHIQRIGPLVKNKPFTLDGVDVRIVHIGQVPGLTDLYAWAVESLETELEPPMRAAYLLVLTGDAFESHWEPVRSFIDSDGFEWHLLRYFAKKGSPSIY